MKNKTETPQNGFGYYWAKECLDDSDADVLLVFFDMDNKIWYGMTNFDINHFTWFEKFYGSHYVEEK